MTAYGFSPTTYDPTDRLTAWNRTDVNLNQSWSLSLAGDWNQFTENTTTQTRTHTGVHELTQINTTPLVHDAKGNLTQNSNSHTYTWDFDNRMNQATVGPNTHSYTYDALGRRVSKTVADGPTNTTTVFVCLTQPIQHSPHAGQVVAEYMGNAPSTSTERKYIYATYIDEPVLILDQTAVGSQPTGTEEKFYYHQNNLYSVAALTDQSGAVQERYSYTADGKPMIFDASMQTLSTSTIGNVFNYTGRRRDFKIGLYFYRARYYDFRLGRFISRDPIRYEAGLNFYRAYFVPNGVDASGMWEGWIPDYLQGDEGYWPDYWQGYEGWIPDIYGSRPGGGTVTCSGWKCMGIAALNQRSHIFLEGAVLEKAASIVQKWVENQYIEISCPDDAESNEIVFDFSDAVDFRSGGGALGAIGGAVEGIADSTSLDLMLGRATVICKGVADLEVCCGSGDNCKYSAQIGLKCDLSDDFDFVPQPGVHGDLYNGLATGWEFMFNTTAGATKPKVSAKLPWLISWGTSGKPKGCN